MFRQADDGAVGFTELPRPSREDLQAMVERLAAKTLAMLRRRGLLEQEPDDALSRVHAQSLQPDLPLSTPPEPRKLSGFAEGPSASLGRAFSLEAGTHVAATNRSGLEHLLRYMLRPPVPLHRLRRLADGRVELTLKRPMHDGTRAVALTPGQLLRRLASIVPPPRVHSTRYFGVFAPASKLRPAVVAGVRGPDTRPGAWCAAVPPAMPPEGLDDGGAEGARVAWALGRELGRFAPLDGPPMPERPRFLAWPQLLQRVFAVDVLRCDKCGGRRKLTAFIVSSREAMELLEHLGFDQTAPPPDPARAPPHQTDWCEPAPEEPGVDPAPPELGIDPQYPD